MSSNFWGTTVQVRPNSSSFSPLNVQRSCTPSSNKKCFYCHVGFNTFFTNHDNATLPRDIFWINVRSTRILFLRQVALHCRFYFQTKERPCKPYIAFLMKKHQNNFAPPNDIQCRDHGTQITFRDDYLHRPSFCIVGYVLRAKRTSIIVERIVVVNIVVKAYNLGYPKGSRFCLEL